MPLREEITSPVNSKKSFSSTWNIKACAGTAVLAILSLCWNNFYAWLKPMETMENDSDIFMCNTSPVIERRMSKFDQHAINNAVIKLWKTHISFRDGRQKWYFNDLNYSLPWIYPAVYPINIAEVVFSYNSFDIILSDKKFDSRIFIHVGTWEFWPQFFPSTNTCFDLAYVKHSSAHSFIKSAHKNDKRGEYEDYHSLSLALEDLIERMEASKSWVEY